MQPRRTTLTTATGIGLATLLAGSLVATANAAPAPEKSPKTEKRTVTVDVPITAGTTVHFAKGSAKLRPAAKVKLNKLAKKIPADAKNTEGDVVGSVPRGGSKARATNRAKNTRDHLKAKGLAGTWAVKGIHVDRNTNVAHKTKKARRAVVTVNYLKPTEVTVDVPAGATITATATASTTVTTTSTATTTETVTATATATATVTVDRQAPQNLTPPTFSFTPIGGDLYDLAFGGFGTWAGEEYAPTSYVARYQEGSLTDGSCGAWDTDGYEANQKIVVNGVYRSDCYRLVVTATNSAGSTIAYSDEIITR